MDCGTDTSCQTSGATMTVRGSNFGKSSQTVTATFVAPPYGVSPAAGTTFPCTVISHSEMTCSGFAGVGTTVGVSITRTDTKTATSNINFKGK